jgi:hypothetical protein
MLKALEMVQFDFRRRRSLGTWICPRVVANPLILQDRRERPGREDKRMSFHPGVVILCQYVKTDGIVCGSPALRERRFCYFHQEWHNQRIRLAFGLSTE